MVALYLYDESSVKPTELCAACHSQTEEVDLQRNILVQLRTQSTAAGLECSVGGCHHPVGWLGTTRLPRFCLDCGANYVETDGIRCVGLGRQRDAVMRGRF